MAVQNIRVNNLNNKISIINSGYERESGIMRVDEKRRDISNAILVASNEGKEIRMYSLKMLLNEFDIKEAVLKMDCEGCEYNILNEEEDVLRKYKRIMLEFHYGYQNIENKLKNAGFSTEAIRIQKFGREDPSLKSMALKNNDYTIGLLYSELI